MGPRASVRGRRGRERKMFGRLLIVLVAGCLILVHRPAHAYLDLPSASMALQVILGTIAAGLVTIKVYWHKIKEFFSSSKDDPKT